MSRRRRQRGKRRGWERGKPRKGSSGGDIRINGHVASVQIKTIYCQTCRSCKGHGPYRYLAWRKGGKVKWKYLGKAD